MSESERITGWIVIVVGMILAAARVAGVTHVAFQAVAHCYMGGILVAFVLVRKYEGKVRSNYLIWLVGIMSAIETGMALLTFFYGPKSLI